MHSIAAAGAVHVAPHIDPDKAVITFNSVDTIGVGMAAHASKQHT